MPRKPGLPDNFKLKTSKETIEKPVELGGFLEETLTRPTPSKPQVPPEDVPESTQGPEPKEEVSTAEQWVEGNSAPVEDTLVPVRRETEEPPVSTAAASPSDEYPEPAYTPPRRQTRIRTQVNLRPDAQALYEKLLSRVQHDSGQRDTKGSEVFTALLFALDEAIPYLDLSSMPPRGAWGTQTAKAFPVALKRAFVRAIGEGYLANRRGRDE